MTFFPTSADDVLRLEGSASTSLPSASVDLLGLEDDPLIDKVLSEVDGGVDEGSGDDYEDDEDAGKEKLLGDDDGGVVFEGLSLPAVVHEETRVVDTENASVRASVEVKKTSVCFLPLVSADKTNYGPRIEYVFQLR